jgi:predicted PurR-regulated permease PerM
MRVVMWLAIAVAFFFFISLIKSILLPFVVGMLAAYFLDPAVRGLRARGCSRSVSSAVITLGFFLCTAALCIVLVPLIAHQLTLLIHDLPGYARSLQAKYNQELDHYVALLSPAQAESLKDALGDFSGKALGWAESLASGALQSGLAILNILSLVFLMPVVAFYLLRDWDKIIAQFNRLLPRDHAATIHAQLHAIDLTLSGFIRGQTNVCLIMAAYYGIALSIVGLNFGLLIGIFSGFVLFVPFVGFITAAVLSIVVALFQFSDGTHILAVLAVYAVGQALEGGLITPRLVGDKVGLHPLWIIFGMLCGAALFGFVGILISVPVTAITGVVARFVVDRYLQSSLYKGTSSVIVNPTGIVSPDRPSC